MHNQITIADVTGSRGCHNDDDKRRAIEAAEEVLKDTDAVEAMLAYIARIDDEPHDTALADIWERAQAAADRAFTQGWADPNNVFVSIEAR